MMNDVHKDGFRMKVVLDINKVSISLLCLIDSRYSFVILIQFSSNLKDNQLMHDLILLKCNYHFYLSI